MNRRVFVSAFLAVPIVGALAACGDPDQQPAEAEPTTPDATADPTPATAAPVAIDHPTGADDVVLKLSNEGGLVPADFHFFNTPTLLVSGDGRVFRPAVVPAVDPGPLVPPVLVHTSPESEVEAMLRLVAEAGLLTAPPDYTGGGTIADAPDTVLTINAAGGTFVHSANALGMTGPESGVRQQLLDATNNLLALLPMAGAVDEAFVPSVYRLQARALAPTEFDQQEPPPTILDWPTTRGLALADASACVRLDASAVGSLLIEANHNTFFRDGDTAYQLFVSGVLPGDPPC
ncbi:MAG TPA: hypothetical protein VFE86_18310 [Ilumatobacteraceae bacterium]|nr:hypothetical protein [Ilumatobacteraceae bacterium]